MIDRRNIKEISHSVEESLSELSDTEILLNFNSAIAKIYPYLIPIHSFAYDSWDNIIEPLYFQMVYETFAYKYGIELKRENCHAYDTWGKCFKNINHIECTPRVYPLEATIDGVNVVLSKEELSGKSIVFHAFGDGVHLLTGGLDIEQAKDVTFDLAQVRIIDEDACIISKAYENKFIFVNKEDLNYEFIAE